jgi:maleate cis-trans isomerase
VVAAAKRLGLRRIVVANKWSEPMNRVLGDFFARGGTQISGVAAEAMGPDKFQKITTADHMELAYELGRQAFTQHPDADGLYIGGGSWLSEPVCRALEREFGRPAITNQSAMIDLGHADAAGRLAANPRTGPTAERGLSPHE